MRMCELNYTVNFDKELSLTRAVEQWVLEWCRKYHPDTFVEAEKFIEKLAQESQKE